MKAKVRVKSLLIKNCNFTCQFIGCDTVCVCNKEYKLACGGNEEQPIIIFDESKEYEADEKIFNFISVHSKETMIIEINDKDAVTGVELIYG